jgi:enterochelin esterase-like enzyme
MNISRLPLLALLTLLCTSGRAQNTTAPQTEATMSIKIKAAKPELIQHKLLEDFSYESPVLTAFNGKPTVLKAAVLLPSGYAKNKKSSYPVRYNIAGYGGRYTRVNRLLKDDEFNTWWTSKEAPQVITVFLNGEGPFGDPYQLNSENSGPYGDALIEEIIPAIDAKYRTQGVSGRFTDGCSTGGWVSLALQLIYPDDFSGCYSYSPDPVSFHRMQLIDIYEDENAFINKHGYERPSKRDRYGEPAFSIKKEVSDENKEGPSGTYVDSGSQWGSWNALYSPRGKNGLPVPVFHPTTGVIDHAIAKQWEKYDLLKMASENWSELGPKVQEKIYVWMGDMDNYYLNNSMRDFDAFLKKTTAPKSDAIIEFEAMKGHCDEYSHRKVLEVIGARN